MSNEDYVDGKITIGEIDEVIFKFKSGKVAKACPSLGSWQQYGTALIDSSVLDVTFEALHDEEYISEDENDD
jgi:hypothetical protein